MSQPAGEDEQPVTNPFIQRLLNRRLVLCLSSHKSRVSWICNSVVPSVFCSSIMVFSSTRRRRAMELGFLVLLLLSIGVVVESKCNRGCEALASYYVWEGSNLTFIGGLMGYQDPFRKILRYNPQVPSKDILQVDTRINIPFSCNCIRGEFLGHVFDYPVRPGDTYERVAETWFSNLTTVDWLQRFNMIPHVNARLNVTVNCSCGNEGVSKDYGLFVTYPLRPGESLSSIATSFNLSAPLLQRYNRDSNFSSGSGLVYIPGKDPSGTYPPLTGGGPPCINQPK